MVNQEVEWRCPDCGSTLGMVVGGELEPFNGNKIRTRGANLEIICSGCNYTKGSESQSKISSGFWKGKGNGHQGITAWRQAYMF